MGTLHAWESFGDNAPPDIQAVAKGLGGGSVVVFSPSHFRTRADAMLRYTAIGAVLMSKKVVDGIRDKGGFWKHGHTYQVGFYWEIIPDFSHTTVVGTGDCLRCVSGRSTSHQGASPVRDVSYSRGIPPLFADRTIAGT